MDVSPSYQTICAIRWVEFVCLLNSRAIWCRIGFVSPQVENLQDLEIHELQTALYSDFSP